MVKLKIISVESKNGATGNFVRANTDKGWLSAFEEPAKTLILQNVGGELECEVSNRESGGKTYRNIVGASVISGQNSGVQNVQAPQTETKEVQVDNKERSVMTSYVKDLVVSGKTINEAIEIVKQARDAFS